MRLIPTLLFSALVAGCGSNAADTGTTSPAPSTTASVAAPVPDNGLAGTVLEQLDAPPYLYLRLQTSQGETWAAVPAEIVANGSAVTIYNPMQMLQFESKTLKRTFAEVYFGTLTPPDAQDAAAQENPHAGLSQPAVSLAVGDIAKATGADAMTIVDTWAQGSALTGKSVSVHGKIVKYNPGIMGKNWLHLQDGSGDASKGTNDLTVTTLDEAALGDVVTITGTVQTNRDFGAGYSYALIVEDAKLSKD